MQIAGTQDKWYIRGTQSGYIDTAMSTTQWNRIVLNSGSWDISITGNAATASSVAWANVSNKPETATRWPGWSEVTTKPTTLSGYGITDANIASGVITLGSNTITPVTSVNGHTGSSVDVTAADLGLSNALHFIGITSTALANGSTTATLTPKSANSLSKTTGFVDGDVVIDND